MLIQLQQMEEGIQKMETKLEISCITPTQVNMSSLRVISFKGVLTTKPLEGKEFLICGQHCLWKLFLFQVEIKKLLIRSI